VNRAVEKVFGQSGLVPVLHGFKTVSIHRLRGTVGRDRLSLLCTRSEESPALSQHYLGHVSDTLQSAANAPVTGHYFHYRLWREGKELTAKGVKLASAGLLPEDTIAPNEPPGEDTAIERQPVATAAIETTTPATPLDQPPAGGETIPSNTSQTAATEPIETTAQPQPKPTRRTVKAIPVDIDRLKLAAARYDIEIRKSKGYGFEMALDQLLMALTADQPQAEPEPTITQAITAQAKTLEFLTTEIEALRKQVAQVSQERDQAIDHADAIAQQNADFAALQAENQRLKSAHASLMQAYNQLLKTGERAAIAPPPNSTTAQTGQLDVPLPRSKTLPKRVSATDGGAPKGGGATARAVRLFRAVQDWNDQHPQATFALTASLLKRDFGIHDRAVEAFFDDHQTEVDDYHQSIGVGNSRSHNRQSGRDVEQLKAFVATRSSET
jgi:hypothetical protein